MYPWHGKKVHIMKIVCIGFPKTGTTSIETALDILGYNICRGHYKNNHSNYLMGLFANGDFDRILKIMDCFDAFADAPWGGSTLYQKIDSRFPEVKFILTTRNTEAWIKSLKNMILDNDPNVETSLDSFYRSGAYGFSDYFRSIFHLDTLVDADDQLRRIYEAFNNDVMHYFANRDNFLHIELEHASWQKLCPFLGKSIPSQDYPRANVRSNPESRADLELTLEDTYRELVRRLAINDTRAVRMLIPVLLAHDPQHFAELIRSGLAQEAKQASE